MEVHGIIKLQYLEIETLSTFSLEKSLIERVNQYFKDRTEVSMTTISMYAD